jgi:hypothetical protein
VPATCRQSLKKRVLRGRLVEMERLWIEFGRESLNLLLGDAQSTGAEGLSHHEIFEVPLAHSNELLLSCISPLMGKMGIIRGDEQIAGFRRF